MLGESEAGALAHALAHALADIMAYPTTRPVSIELLCAAENWEMGARRERGGVEQVVVFELAAMTAKLQQQSQL